MVLRSRLFILTVALFPLLLCLRVHAQDDDDGDDQGQAPKTAFLSLDAQNNGQVYFFLSSNIPFSARGEVAAFFTGGWKCSIGDPRPRDDRTRLSNLAPEKRAVMEGIWKQWDARTMNGTCSELFGRNALRLSGNVDVQPLLHLLQQDGVENLRLNLRVPNVGDRAMVEPPGNTMDPYPGFPSSHWFMLPLSLPAAPVHVSFGYSRAALARLAGYTSLFLLVPLVVVLTMRTAALRRGTNDAAGAWFSYMQTTQLFITGAMILWAVTPLNTRGQLVELASFMGWRIGWRAVAARLLVTAVPAWSIYLLWMALSYKVFVRIRNASWTWTQFMARQVLELGTAVLTLPLTVAGILTMFHNFRAGAALVGLSWLLAIALGQLHLKLEKRRPAAIPSGPLRDRVFALAQALGVKVRQVFVLPAARSGMANAFATSKQNVLFTDYLIEKLSRREVDAVAAHELTHLRHNHAGKLGLMVIGAIALPGLIPAMAPRAVHELLRLAPHSLMRINGIIDSLVSGWTQAVVLLISVWILHFIQKRFEYAADAGAVAVTRDPEALITALVKLSHSNLIPLQWGRGSEALLTHPSTMRRLQRIARSSGISESQLSQLMTQAETVPADSYVVSAATQGMVTPASRNKLLVLIALHIFPPAAIAFVLQRYFPADGFIWPALLAGALAAVAVYHLTVRWMGWRGNRRVAKETRKNLAGKTGSFKPEQGIAVGFAPTAEPRFFVSGYNWDQGLVFLSSEKIVFVGSHCALGLKRDQIRTIVLGKGAPSWSRWQRVYFHWEDRETGRSGCFNLLPLEQESRFRPDSRPLYLRLQAWHSRQDDSIEASPADEFAPPVIGAVTSKSPKEVNKPSRTLSLTLFQLAMASGLSLLLKLDRSWYVLAMVLLIRLWENIPYWRYREGPVVLDAANVPTPPPPPASAVAVPPPPALQAGAPSPPPGIWPSDRT
jgi:Zn-dependent protease with chaperone function